MEANTLQARQILRQFTTGTIWTNKAADERYRHLGAAVYKGLSKEEQNKLRIAVKQAFRAAGYDANAVKVTGGGDAGSYGYLGCYIRVKVLSNT